MHWSAWVSERVQQNAQTQFSVFGVTSYLYWFYVPFSPNVPSLQLSIIKLCVLPRLMSYLLLWPVNSVSTCPVRPSVFRWNFRCVRNGLQWATGRHTRIKWWIWIFRLLILIEEKNLIWNGCCSASSIDRSFIADCGPWRLLVWWICINRSTAATHISIRNFMNPINVKIKLFVHCVDRIHFHGARIKPDFCNWQICAPRWFCKIHRYSLHWTGSVACNAKYRVINANNNEFIDRKVPTTYFYYILHSTENGEGVKMEMFKCNSSRPCTQDHRLKIKLVDFIVSCTVSTIRMQ